MMNKKAQIEEWHFTIGVIVVVGAALIICSMGFDMVDASHVGVMNQFGQIKGVMQPGVQWTGLFTQVYTYDLRTRPVEISLGESDSAATSDGQSVYADIKVNWHIKPDSVENLYRHVGTDDQVYQILNIEGRIKNGFKSVTVKYKDGLDIINHRDQVIGEAVKAIQENFPSEYAEIEYIVIPQIRFKQEYQDQIDAKKAAEQEALKTIQQVQVFQAEAEKRVATAEGDKQSRIKAADADKYEKIAAAQGDAEAIKIKGQAVADALAAQRNQMTSLTVQSAWIDAWKSGGAQVPKWITSDKSGSFLMQLNTDEVKQQ